MKAVIIDFSRSNELKILNTRITSSVSIISGVFIPLSQEEDPLRVAADKLQQQGLLSLPAIIIPPSDLVEKHIFHFPKMPDKEINKVLPRQIAEVKDSQEVRVFNYIKNGIVEDRQTEKLEISAFFCGKEKLFAYLDRMKSLGIQPKKIIPEAQGLKTLVEINAHLHSSDRSGLVLLDLMAQRISLNIFRDVYWGLERDFLYRMETADDLNEEDFSRISTELNRTFQYFKQRNRNYSIERIVLYGSSPNIENLKNLINDNVPTPATVLDAEFFKDKISLPPHLKESHEFISKFALSIATGVAVTGKKYLDVFPGEFRDQSTLVSRLIALGISGIIIAFILIASTFYFEGINKSYKQDLAALQKSFYSLNRNAGTIENTKKMRAIFFKQRLVSSFPFQYSNSASDFIRKLSLIAPEPIELMELEITPRTQSFTFVLNGKIKGGDNIEAQSKFLEFYQALKEFDSIMNVESSNVNVSPGDISNPNLPQPNSNNPNAPNASDTQENRKKVELFFTIEGEVELL